MPTPAEERAARLATLPFETSATSSARGVTGFVASLREIFGHRELLDLLIRRELKARYKDSSLGFLWSFIRPLTMLLIYYVAIGQFLGAARMIPDFAIYVFAGLTLWGLYSDVITGGTASIVSNAGLIKKVYLPREIFPLASVGSSLFNFGIQFLILIAATVVLGQFPLSWNLLYVPLAVLIVVIWAMAFGIMLSALNVFLRDIQYLVEVVMLILFWASPIVYSWGLVVNAVGTAHAWLLGIYSANPMTVAVLAFQKGIWKAGSESREVDGQTLPAQIWPENLDMLMLIMIVVGLLFLVLAQRIFSRLQGNFAQEI